MSRPSFKKKLGKILAKPAEKLAINAVKNPRIALETGAKVGYVGVSGYPKAVLSTVKELLSVYSRTSLGQDV